MVWRVLDLSEVESGRYEMNVWRGGEPRWL